MPKKTVRKKDKAWAVFDECDNGLRYANSTPIYAIYVFEPVPNKYDVIVPCTITYHLPTPARRKRG